MLENFPPVETREPATSKSAVTPIPPAPAPFPSRPTVREEGMTELPDLDDAKLILGAAAIVLGENHTATMALARAVTTRKPEDIERSRLALRTIHRDRRPAIAAVAEEAWEAEERLACPDGGADNSKPPGHSASR